MTDTDLFKQLVEARAALAIAEQKLAKYEVRKTKNRDRMRFVRAQVRTSAHNVAQSPPLPLVSSSSPTPPIITSLPLPPELLLASLVKADADAPDPKIEQFDVFPDQQKPAKSTQKGGGVPPAWRRPGGLQWMGLIQGVFQAAYGVQPEGRGWGKALCGVVDRLGVEEVVAELEAYCEMTPMTYLNMHKFAELCGGWRAEAERMTNRRASWGQHKLTPSEQVAESFALIEQYPERYILNYVPPTPAVPVS